MKISLPRRRIMFSIALAILLAGVGFGYYLYRWWGKSAGRSANVIAWIRNPSSHPEWAVQAGQRCGQAPFLLPTNGFIGYLWRDTFKLGSLHQGIDIFSGTAIAQIAVVAAYSGYLTRLPDWKSSLIIRIPDDPLHPGRQIWTYYTHMADPQGRSLIDPAFPPGASEVYVQAGDLLGHQGDYSGDPSNPTGVHLHFSIVLDDGLGKFRNELDVRNTLDPSPYLGLPLNADENQGTIPKCE